MASTKTEGYQAPALDKGLDILEFLADAAVPQSQTQIAQGLGREPHEIFRASGGEPQSPPTTLVGTVNDICALAALRAFEEAGVGPLGAVIGQNAIREARNELRRPGTRLIGTVAYFPERYGDELLPLALNLLEHKPVPPATFVKHQLLTPKNVDLIYPLDRPGNMPSAELKERCH